VEIGPEEYLNSSSGTPADGAEDTPEIVILIFVEISVYCHP
jgi:hypothetical protein